MGWSKEVKQSENKLRQVNTTQTYYGYLTSQIHNQQFGYLVPDIWKRRHALDTLFSPPAL